MYLQFWQNILLRFQQELHSQMPFLYMQFQSLTTYLPYTFNFANQKVLIEQYYQFGKQHVLGHITKKYPNLEDPYHCAMQFLGNYFFEYCSPQNYWYFNENFWQEFSQTKGQNLIRGYYNFVYDAIKQRISTVDESKFKIGENIANTPGDVIFRNELIEVIHYHPVSNKVFNIPLLIIPPFINKFYILDLGDKNSVIKNLLAKGHDVFIISWRNFDIDKQEGSDLNFEDYVLKGGLAAVNAVLEYTKSNVLNLMGYCVGGTLTAILAAYLKDRKCVNSITFLTTLLDFSHVGYSKAFVNKDSIDFLDQNIELKKGMSGQDMFSFFSILRAQDMIFTPIINNYFLGKTAPNFDLLFWNNDSTNIPAKVAKEYLRFFYIDNILEKSNMMIQKHKIDLKDLKMPIFCMSAISDHIAPAQGIINSMNLLGKNADNIFLMVDSGHVASVVLGIRKSYKFWCGNYNKKIQSLEQWMKNKDTQVCEDKIWWNLWHEWMEKFSGEKLSKKNIKTHDVIDCSPGKYVL